MSTTPSQAIESEIHRGADGFIAEEHSVGQDRALAAQPSRSAQQDEKPAIEPSSEDVVGVTTSETPADGAETVSHPSSAVFSVQLELRSDGSVRRTVVKHARTESGEEQPDQWPGWDAARLVSFIEQHAQLRSQADSSRTMFAGSTIGVKQELPPIQAVIEKKYRFKGQVEVPADTPATVRVDDSMPPTPSPTPPPQTEAVLSGALHMRELETSIAGIEGPHNMLRASEQLHLRLTLDLSDVVAPPDALMSYKAAVYAKQLDGSRRITLAEGSGNIKMAKSAQIELFGQDLPSGFYRLTAITTLNTPNSPARSQLMAFLESGLVEVLD